MAIAEVKKIEIIAHLCWVDKLLERLRKHGVVEIKKAGEEELTASCSCFKEFLRDSEEKLKGIKYVVGYLKNFVPAKMVKEKIKAGKLILKKKEIAQLIKSIDVFSVEEECRVLEKESQELQREKNNLKLQIEQLRPWKKLMVPLKELTDTKYVRFLLGGLPQDKYDLLVSELSNYEGVLVHEIYTEKKIKYGLVIFLKEDTEIIQKVLKKYSFNQVGLPSVPVMCEELISQKEHLSEKVRIKQKQVEEKAKNKAKDFINFVILSDYYENMQKKEEVKKKFLKTKSVFYLTGWILARKQKEVKEDLENKFPEIEIDFKVPGKNEDIPVALENKKIVEPFEVITDLYGRPFYSGMDPTPVLALFYALFFGLCITDAGYGIIICLITSFSLVYFRKKMDEQLRKFIALFLLGGVCTILMGMMTGGWFGMTVKWKLFDPLNDLQIFFAIALSLGVIHVICGLGMKIYENIGYKQWQAAIWDQGLWILLILSSIGWAITKMGIISGGMCLLFKVGIFVAVFGIICFQGRTVDKNLGEKTDKEYTLLWITLIISCSLLISGIFKFISAFCLVFSFLGIIYLGRRNILSLLGRIGLGCYALYGSTAYLGDILSYSRLVALGLGTGIVGLVVNKMAGVAAQTPIYISIILVPLILLLGHTFNLAINILSAFVHSCRLQYVEFFTKFYQSGGKFFKPFKEEYKYITIQSDDMPD
ncbi:V-type ATP synthase subunit I [bacterium]|nr:V-type ATP synthase subunit I [bacterium]